MFDAAVDGATRRVEVRARTGGHAVILDGRALAVDLVETGDHFASLLLDGHSHELAVEGGPGSFRIHFRDETLSVELTDGARGATGVAPRAAGPLRIATPMPGRIVRVLVSAGNEVASGQSLAVVEAMKMENDLRAPRAGRVLEVAVREGQTVESGALVVVID